MRKEAYSNIGFFFVLVKENYFNFLCFKKDKLFLIEKTERIHKMKNIEEILRIFSI